MWLEFIQFLMPRAAFMAYENASHTDKDNSHKLEWNEPMNDSEKTRGGTPEQHAKAGQQSHKSTSTGSSSGEHSGTQGGSHEQHVKAGEQSHKSTGSGSSSSGEHSGTQGGTHEQHVKAGEQSHKKS